ncbi:MAG TPA: hypothetical protein VKF80_00990 [Candidatus Eisenbacteria bacterium]|nr:hypothetical protein [Candidatus Eisenbacteria bacterium]
MSSKRTLGQELLDSLVDGPSSFADIYRYADRFLRPSKSPRFSVDQLLEALRSMEAFGRIKALLRLPGRIWKEPDDIDRQRVPRAYEDWLPKASYEEMSFDEVGLWFELQPAGRTEWASGQSHETIRQTG